MDHYSEQLVTKRRTGGDTAKIALTLLGGILIGSVIIYFALLTGMWALIIGGMLLVGLGAWLAAGFGVEYEYIVTNNELDIDKILGKRKRKRMITIDISKSTSFEPYPGTQDAEADVTVHASTGMEKDAYCLVCNHNDYGTVKIIFNPDERTRETITQELPRQLKQKVNDNG